jgi:hypothetical protein
MNELRELLRDTVRDRMSITGDTVTSLRTGRTFSAEVESVANLELNTELGRDPRESVLLHVADRVESSLLKVNDKVKLIIFGEEVTLRVCRRDDNPANAQVEFGCAKFIPGIDT